MNKGINTWVAEELRRAADLGEGGLSDIGQVSVHPGGGQVACTLTSGSGEARTRQVEVVDLHHGVRTSLGLPHASTHSAQWSPAGDRLCLLADLDTGQTQALVLRVDGTAVESTSQVDGTVETSRWSPDGNRLAMIVAEAGAEISDVYGSGVVSDGSSSSWMPRVSPAGKGMRHLVVWDLRSGATQRISTTNVWECSWLTDDSLVAMVSDTGGEGAWYSATLSLLPADGGTPVPTYVPAAQLAQPRSNRSGTRWSVLSGVASDRGLLAGDLLVAVPGGQPRVADTVGAHVTDHVWIGDSGILFIGMSGLDTVIGRWDADAEVSTVLWRGPQSSGLHQPELAAVEGRDPVIVLEHHDLPPTLGEIVDGEFRAVLAVEGPGTQYLMTRTGDTTQVSWTSSDASEVQGLLTLPVEPGPHALVVNIHGGPIAAWHDGWLGRDPVTSLLVSRGYAVLRPNPRGSTGRGATWAEAVIGDMGGLDVDDILTGVTHLVDRGLVDPDRVGLTGNSYGGYMSAWIPCVSDVFAATVSRSPVTDWRSQHFTSNLAEFDRLMLVGDPMDSDSQYATRSPAVMGGRISTPILLTAGALDLACPPSQAQYLHSLLLENGVPTELAIYPEEGHGVRGAGAVIDQAARMIGWFERFMAPGPR